MLVHKFAVIKVLVTLLKDEGSFFYKFKHKSNQPNFDHKFITRIVNAQCVFAVLNKMLRILHKLRVNLDPVAP